jgi:hypothetical protein
LVVFQLLSFGKLRKYTPPTQHPGGRSAEGRCVGEGFLITHVDADMAAIEGGSVNRCFKTPVIIANTGYRKGLQNLENWAAEKSRLSSHISPRAVEIGRCLLPIFRISLFEKLFRPGNTYFYLPSPPLKELEYHGE